MNTDLSKGKNETNEHTDHLIQDVRGSTEVYSIFYCLQVTSHNNMNDFFHQKVFSSMIFSSSEQFSFKLLKLPSLININGTFFLMFFVMLSLF